MISIAETTAVSTRPTTLHGLSIISPQEAAARGFVSITLDIQHWETAILASICAHRNPERAALIRVFPSSEIYQLAILHEDAALDPNDSDEPEN